MSDSAIIELNKINFDQLARVKDVATARTEAAKWMKDNYDFTDRLEEQISALNSCHTVRSVGQYCWNAAMKGMRIKMRQA